MRHLGYALKQRVILSGVTGGLASPRSCGASGYAVEESLFGAAIRYR